MASRSKKWHARELREEALALRCNGLRYREIAEKTGISIDTVKSWSRRYSQTCGGVNSTADTEEMIQDEADLESIEICELPQSVIGRIFLICGTVRFGGKYDHFASQVPQMLEYNLQSGDVFVFCNYSRHQLSVLQWQGDGFVLMFRRTEEERYPWPRLSKAKAVEITRPDLEMLVEYPRFMRRLRGLPTPEFMG